MKMFSSIRLAVAVATVSVAALVAPQKVQAQYQPNITNLVPAFSALTINSASAVTVGTSTNKITLRQNNGDAFVLSMVAANSTTANVTIWFDVSADGVNWTTDHPFIWQKALNGTTTVITYTNFDRNVLNNVRYISPTIVSNAAAVNATINFLTESHSNQ